MEKIDKHVLNGQIINWEKTYSLNTEVFGDEPSEVARKTAELFRQEGSTNILELGGGQGRDTLYFASQGFNVTCLDYAAEGVKNIAQKAQEAGLSHAINVICHDVRQSLPFTDASFDACYSHMLFCMALTTVELVFLSQEIRRILKPGGLNVYTVRHTGDSHYGTGISRGEDMY